jgi:molybdopterin synthase catalytic subunit
MHITDIPIDIHQMLADSHHPQSGAVVLFCGDVRNHNLGRQVLWLSYEAHEALAEKVIASILEDARGKWNLQIAMCQHRIGKVSITETAILVITCSAHRREAYESNQYIVERVKLEAPIWKQEFFDDGSNEWARQGLSNLTY